MASSTCLRRSTSQVGGFGGRPCATFEFVGRQMGEAECAPCWGMPCDVCSHAVNYPRVPDMPFAEIHGFRERSNHVHSKRKCFPRCGPALASESTVIGSSHHTGNCYLFSVESLPGTGLIYFSCNLVSQRQSVCFGIRASSWIGKCSGFGKSYFSQRHCSSLFLRCIAEAACPCPELQQY